MIKEKNNTLIADQQSRIVRREAVGDALPGLDAPAILQRVYQARGITNSDEIDRSLPGLLPAEALNGMQDAVELIVGVMELGGRILIVGDFDADGATSSALAVLALRAMGHAEVDFLVPNRFEYGYGLTPEIVEQALQRHPDLIVTVDNGVSSIEGVNAAHRAGVSVLVTDHHLPGDTLPAAAAIVNPNLRGSRFGSKSAAGVGVIFYVLLGVRARLRDLKWFERRDRQPPNMANFLDLVALGTVADVVPLDKNNRILVHQGLQRIRAGRARPGILALLQVAGRDYQRVQASDMGFAVGPRLNAAGRLDDMRLGIECLLAEHPNAANELAAELDCLNRERRSIEDDMKQQAEQLLASWQHADEALPWGLCLLQDDWHQGVIGILASRIKERYHRPVIAFAPADNDTIKGSARSIPGLHIRDALDQVATRHPQLLSKFGGHAMAAGMSIARADFAAFSTAFDEVVREQLNEDDLNPVLMTDGGIAPQEMNLATAAAIGEGGPWGQGFVEPLFDDVFDVKSQRIVGEKHWKLVLRHQSGAPTVDAIAFNAVEDHPALPERVHAAYRMDINEWRGQTQLQLRIEHLEPA